jgi:hypothetical protein
MNKGLSIRDACRRLGVSEKDVRAMMADGRLPYRSLGAGRIVIPFIPESTMQFQRSNPVIRNSRMRAVTKAIKRSRPRAASSVSGSAGRPSPIGKCQLADSISEGA